MSAISASVVCLSRHQTHGLWCHGKIDFLVQEGQIRAEAIVCHVKPARDWDLKLTDWLSQMPTYRALMTRLCRLPQFEPLVLRESVICVNALDCEITSAACIPMPPRNYRLLHYYGSVHCGHS